MSKLYVISLHGTALSCSYVKLVQRTLLNVPSIDHQRMEEDAIHQSIQEDEFPQELVPHELRNPGEHSTSTLFIIGLMALAPPFIWWIIQSIEKQTGFYLFTDYNGTDMISMKVQLLVTVGILGWYVGFVGMLWRNGKFMLSVYSGICIAGLFIIIYYVKRLW